MLPLFRHSSAYPFYHSVSITSFEQIFENAKIIIMVGIDTEENEAPAIKYEADETEGILQCQLGCVFP